MAIDKASDLRYADIEIGAIYEFEREITEHDVATFAALTGDFNPLHVDKEFGQKSRFKANIAHGMLAGSLFSRLIGMYCPGERSLYMTQSLKFRIPIFCNDTVTVRGTVIDKNDSIRVITLRTEILKSGKVVIDGEAKIMVME
jgi:3-hydroxybutyryl-CoA dehydratase